MDLARERKLGIYQQKDDDFSEIDIYDLLVYST